MSRKNHKVVQETHQRLFTDNLPGIDTPQNELDYKGIIKSTLDSFYFFMQ